MKKVSVRIFGFAVSLFLFAFVAALQAFDLGGMAKGTAKGATRGAVQKEYNKRLKQQKCKFVGDSTNNYTGCNLDQVVSELNAFRRATESSGLAGDVDIEVQTFGSDWDLAQKRAEFLRDKIQSQFSGWDYVVRYNTTNSNEVLFQVLIQ